jgi:hypothetical protein
VYSNALLKAGGTGVSQDFNNLIINKPAGSLTITRSNLDVDLALTITAGTLDLNGNNVTTTTSLTNHGTIRLQGAETVSWATNYTTDGTYEYYGAGAGPYTIKVFTGDDYYNLSINAANGTDIFNLDTNIVLAGGSLSAGAGILSLSGYNITGGSSLICNSGWIRLKGIETVFWTTIDGMCGTFEYIGNNTPDNITIKNFGASGYFNLIINDTNVSKATFVLSADLRVNGNLTISSGTLDVTASNYSITSSGNWTDSATFTQRSGLIIFNGTNRQLITTGSNSFYNMTVTNVSKQGLRFVDACTILNNFTSILGGTQLSFNGTSTYAFKNIVINGQSIDKKIVLQSYATGIAWLFNVAGTQSVSYVVVSDSNASGSVAPIVATKSAGTNVTNWSFSMARDFGERIESALRLESNVREFAETRQLIA